MHDAYPIIVVPKYNDGDAAMECMECGHTGYDPDELRKLKPRILRVHVRGG